MNTHEPENAASVSAGVSGSMLLFLCSTMVKQLCKLNAFSKR